MSTIRKYVVVDTKGNEDGQEFDTLQGAIESIVTDEPLAVVERIYEFADSELAWTSTGDETWPPAPPVRFESAGSIVNGEVVYEVRRPVDGDTATCRNCNEDIEYTDDNDPPWTHTDTGYSDCPVEDGEEPSGFHAEPT